MPTVKRPSNISPCAALQARQEAYNRALDEDLRRIFRAKIDQHLDAEIKAQLGDLDAFLQEALATYLQETNDAFQRTGAAAWSEWDELPTGYDPFALNDPSPEGLIGRYVFWHPAARAARLQRATAAAEAEYKAMDEARERYIQEIAAKAAEKAARRASGKRRPSVEVQHERVLKEYAWAVRHGRWKPPVMWSTPSIITLEEYETRHLRMNEAEREGLVRSTLGLAQLHGFLSPSWASPTRRTQRR
jgi:hypothetical protein